LDQPVNLLITEVAHFPAARLFDFLFKKSIQKILLTHLPTEWVANEEKLFESARAALPGKDVTIARDGMRVEI
jgi:ribonuclease BN (tRNA processing enzyme)